MTRDWDAELKKIDKRLQSLSDESLLPAPAKAPARTTPGAQGAPVLPGLPVAPREEPRRPKALSTLWRLTLVAALGVGMIFWPYPNRCGAGLFAYLGAVGVLIGAGVWTSVWTWRHRVGKGHVLALLTVLWGGILGAMEILPRIGYALPSEAHPTTWMCQ